MDEGEVNCALLYCEENSRQRKSDGNLRRVDALHQRFAPLPQ